MRILSALTLAAALFLPSAARADGVIYKLPADGTSADFDMKLSMERNGQSMEVDGTLTIKSVGKQTVDGAVCRWIEIKFVMKMGDRERTTRVKVLVPEEELVRGKTPIDHVKKAWLKREDRAPKEITDFYSNDAGPLPWFLSGPPKDAKDLDAETVESSLGKLECKGVTGAIEYTQTNGRKNVVTFTNRLHEKAPFGIVSSEMRVVNSLDGQNERKITIKITLSKVGKDATSDIPDAE